MFTSESSSVFLILFLLVLLPLLVALLLFLAELVLVLICFLLECLVFEVAAL